MPIYAESGDRGFDWDFANSWWGLHADNTAVHQPTENQENPKIAERARETEREGEREREIQ